MPFTVVALDWQAPQVNEINRVPASLSFESGATIGLLIRLSGCAVLQVSENRVRAVVEQYY